MRNGPNQDEAPFVGSFAGRSKLREYLMAGDESARGLARGCGEMNMTNLGRATRVQTGLL